MARSEWEGDLFAEMSAQLSAQIFSDDESMPSLEADPFVEESPGASAASWSLVSATFGRGTAAPVTSAETQPGTEAVAPAQPQPGTAAASAPIQSHSGTAATAHA